jgi:2-phospho-L-lactate guanylyltransferase
MATQPLIGSRQRWRLLVPVKPLAAAKSRLAPVAGGMRSRLALAMALDTVEHALSARLVAGIVVVTDDAEVARAVRPLGADVLSGAPRGLNAALQHAAARVLDSSTGSPVAALTADLPALSSAELDRALRESREWPRAFVADASGLGTTMLCVRSGGPLLPAFGAGSARRHAANGAHAVGAGLATLRRDVDEVTDLQAAVRLGLGAHTAAVLADLPALAG